jgi:hypothetical protein
MITAFEERLLETLFPEYGAWSSYSIASYVMHRGNLQPLFFRELTDDVLDYALANEKNYSVFSVKTDGSVDDVTEAWSRVFEKHKSTRGAIDTLLKDFERKLPENVATMEVKAGDLTLGYYPKPTLHMLRCVDRVRDLNRLSVLVIHTNGVVKDMTSEVIQFFKEYSRLRLKGMSSENP